MERLITEINKLLCKANVEDLELFLIFIECYLRKKKCKELKKAGLTADVLRSMYSSEPEYDYAE